MKILAAVSLPLLAAGLAAVLAPLDAIPMISAAGILAAGIGSLMALRRGKSGTEAAIEGGLAGLGAICLAMVATVSLHQADNPGVGYAVAGGCGATAFLGVRGLVAIVERLHNVGGDDDGDE